MRITLENGMVWVRYPDTSYWVGYPMQLPAYGVSLLEESMEAATDWFGAVLDLSISSPYIIGRCLQICMIPLTFVLWATSALLWISSCGLTWLVTGSRGRRYV